MGKTSEDVANETWRQGFFHLTVDGFGLVSLWDEATPHLHGQRLEDMDSYVKFPLTKEQQELLEATMKKGGYTP